MEKKRCEKNGMDAFRRRNAKKTGGAVKKVSLCAFVRIYVRSERFMRVREDLCAFSEIYARSGKFTRVQPKIPPPKIPEEGEKLIFSSAGGRRMISIHQSCRVRVC